MKKILAISIMLMLCFSIFANGAAEKTAAVDLSDYPSKTVNFIVNRAAGGATDLVARAIANALQKDKGIVTSVSNFDGGDGLIGVNELMNSAPDGYTFCVIGSTEIPNMMANFEEATFSKSDLAPVAQIAAQSRIMTAKPNSQFKTIYDVQAYAKAHPGELTVAVPGSNLLYLVDMLGKELGCEFTAVNAGSGNNAFTMVLGGHSELAIVGSKFYKNCKTENMVILGDTMPVQTMADGFGPTFISQGINFTDTAFTYVLASKGTPEEYRKVMSDLIEECLNNGSLQEGIKNASQEAVFMGYDEFVPFYENYIDVMIPILKK